MLRFTVTFSMLFPNVCGVHKTSFVFVAIYFGLDEETARTGCSVALIKRLSTRMQIPDKENKPNCT